MSKRKISECINVRINVGNYQHIEITKYAEEEIEYSSVAERIEKEKALCDDLTQSLMSSMAAIPERLGKGVDNAVQVEESIKKAIPEWLANNPVPNIANNAKKREIQATAEAKNHKEELTEVNKEVLSNVKEVEKDIKPTISPVATLKVDEKDEKDGEELFDMVDNSKKKDSNEDLFGDDIFDKE